MNIILTLLSLLNVLWFNTTTTEVTQYIPPEKWFLWDDAGRQKTNAFVISHAAEIEKLLKWSVSVADADLEHYRLIDFDRDGDWDLYFNGFAGANNKYILIFLNKNGTYVKTFQLFGEIKNAVPAYSGGEKVTIYSPGCCADPEDLELEVLFSFRKDTLKFNFLSINVYHVAVQKDSVRFEKPQKIAVDAKEAAMRFHPFVDDTTMYPPGDTTGNFYRTYYLGDRGKATAEKKDASGNIWWFVEMNPSLRDTSYFFQEYGVLPAYRGWIEKAKLRAE